MISFQFFFCFFLFFCSKHHFIKVSENETQLWSDAIYDRPGSQLVLMEDEGLLKINKIFFQFNTCDRIQESDELALEIAESPMKPLLSIIEMSIWTLFHHIIMTGASERGRCFESLLSCIR